MRVFFTTYFLLSAFTSFTIDFSTLNTSYWYQANAEVSVNFSLAQQREELHVFIKAEGDSIVGNKIQFLLQDGFEDPNHAIIDNPVLDTLSVSRDVMIFKMTLTSPPDDLMVVHVKTIKFNYYFPVKLSKGDITYPGYYLTGNNGLPVFTNYLDGGNFSFQFLGSPDSMYFYQYDENFPPADPPMGVTSGISATIDIDTVFAQKDSFQLETDHFYFAQLDTLSTEGIAFYLGNAYYPRFRKLEELIKPLTYISRQSEISQITASGNPKNSFDKFWINTFSSKQLARSAIRNYYRKVTRANELFTDYKQGWKTDRGILYIVFGAPDEVFRTNRTEVWVFDGTTTFEFRILSNLFTPNLYVLMRDEKYRDAWISKVRILRGGK